MHAGPPTAARRGRPAAAWSGPGPRAAHGDRLPAPLHVAAHGRLARWPYRICVFKFVEGRSRGEIAELLAISASTYTRAKRRALERIAEALPHLVRMQNSE